MRDRIHAALTRCRRDSTAPTIDQVIKQCIRANIKLTISPKHCKYVADVRKLADEERRVPRLEHISEEI